MIGETVDADPHGRGCGRAGECHRRAALPRGGGHGHPPHALLAFVPDQVPDEARRMEELLARTRESDAEVARLAAGARPAGRPRPVPRATGERADEE